MITIHLRLVENILSGTLFFLILLFQCVSNRYYVYISIIYLGTIGRHTIGTHGTDKSEDWHTIRKRGSGNTTNMA